MDARDRAGLEAKIAGFIAEARRAEAPSTSSPSVRHDANSNTFTVLCDCGWGETREYTSTSPLGDFYDVREQIEQSAADHAETCRRTPERLWPKDGA